MAEAFEGNEIRLFLVNGDPDGVIHGSILGDWDGWATVLSRAYLKEMGKREECNTVGVYVLLGKTPRDGGGEEEHRVYIGQSENVAERIKQHITGVNPKGWWERACVITCKEDWFTSTQARYLEHKMIAQARAAVQVDLDNENTPKVPTISESQIHTCERFLGKAQMMIKFLLGTDIFSTAKALQSGIKETASSLGDQTTPLGTLTDPLPKEEVMFEMEAGRKGVRVTARARYIKGKWVMQKGSQGLKNLTPSLVTYRKLHERLRKEDILVQSIEKEGVLQFSKEYVFNSPSAAATTVTGRSMNGPECWRLPETGKPYAQWKNFKQWEQEELSDKD